MSSVNKDSFKNVKQCYLPYCFGGGMENTGPLPPKKVKMFLLIIKMFLLIN